MKKPKFVIPSLLGLTAIGIALVLQAQEFKPKKGAEEAVPAEEVPPVDVQGDQGIHAAKMFQENTDGGEHHPDKTASGLMDEFMAEVKLVEGWDGKKKRMFVKGVVELNCEDPSFSSQFATIRELLVKRAILQAKAEIIKSINSEMSAKDQLTMPGTDVYSKLGAEYEEAELKLQAQKRAVERLLGEARAAKISADEGVTVKDRYCAFLDAAIKQLDKDYSAEKLDAKKKARYDKAKRQYQEAVAAMEKLEKEAEKAKGEVVSSFSSEVSVHAKMPLVGTSVLYQTESWDEEEEMYQVAVLVGWSQGLEKAARAYLTGEEVAITERPDKQSVREWLADQDLGVMVGPRQFLDNNGRRWFVAISARTLPKASAARNRVRATTALFARQMVAYSLYADVQSCETARALMQEKSAGLDRATEAKVAESLETKMSQGFEKRQVQGIAPLLNKEVTHPVSGRKIFVSVMGLNPDLSAKALALMAQQYKIAIAANKRSEYIKGYKAALDGKLAASRNDPAARAKGGKDGNAALAAKNKKGGKSGSGKKGASTSKKGNPKSGAFGGKKPKKKSVDDF